MAEEKNPQNKQPARALAKQALPVQRVRGLRQYQKQQSHVVQPAKTKTHEGAEKTLDGYLSKGVVDTFVEISKSKESKENQHKSASSQKRNEKANKGISQKAQSTSTKPTEQSQTVRPKEIETRPKVENPPASGKVSEPVAKRQSASAIKEKTLQALSPYQSFVAELSPQDMEYLLRESSSAIRVLLLKNASRATRSRILQQMPRKQRAELLRDLAESLPQLGVNECSKAFHWLQRKVQQKRYPAVKIEGVEADAELDADEAGGVKTLSVILDGLEPEQEESIVAFFQRDDGDLAMWLERDRGSAEQRRILRELCTQLQPLELATLFAEPRHGRLLRHLLNAEQMLEVLNSSIDLAQLSEENRSDIAEEIYSNFPVLQTY